MTGAPRRDQIVKKEIAQHACMLRDSRLCRLNIQDRSLDAEKRH